MGLWDWLFGRRIAPASPSTPAEQAALAADPVELVRLVRPRLGAAVRQIACGWVLQELADLLDYRSLDWVDALDRGEADESDTLAAAARDAADETSRHAEAEFMHALGDEAARNIARREAAQAARLVDRDEDDAIDRLAATIRAALDAHGEAVWDHGGVLQEHAASEAEVARIEAEFVAKVARFKRAAIDARLCAVVRDVAGEPDRPPTFDPAWRTAAVLDLAREMIDRREFARMSKLADALRSAGCTDGAVLSHCRGPGPHVRGCWVLRLVVARP